MTKSTKVHPSIFRAYDIRGIAGETLTSESVFLIAKALGTLIQSYHLPQISIARDGRCSSPELSVALAKGLIATGCKVLDIGMVPTPLLYYSTHLFETRSGVMLTGSHNPRDYNGMKIVVNGAALAEHNLQELYQRIVREDFITAVGEYQEVNIQQTYIQDVVNNIQLKRPLKIVVDAGNGATSQLAPLLYKALGCEVVELYCEVDGTFPNHHPDPSQPQNMQALSQWVQQANADLGFAFDGDGDRLGMVTNTGEIINPDRILMLFAQSLLQKKPNAKIIYDVKCSNRLTELILALKGQPIMWKTGHSLIKAKLAETKAELAGEMSGHFFFNDRWYGFDDALYAGARLLEILSLQTLSAHDVFANIPNSINTPELKIYVREEDKFSLMQRLIDKAQFTDSHEIYDIDGLRINFAQGWGLVRPSNTTPYLILRFEAVNESILKKIQNIFKNWMLTVEPNLVLPF